MIRLRPAETVSTGSAIDARALPRVLRLFGALCLVGGLAAVVPAVLYFLAIVQFFRTGSFREEAVTPVVITAVMAVAVVAVVTLFILLGIRLLRNKRRFAVLTCEALMALLVLVALCNMMLYGVDGELIFYGVLAVLLLVVSGYIDPSLAQERELQRRLRDMETREAAEEGTLGLDESGKGFIALNFFNVFWIFVVASIIGLLIEEVYHFVVVEPGEIQDRAGLLFGPFSPIYGVGAVLMTIALNRFHDKSPVLIFLVSAVIGGAFEYFVSWFMEVAFGAVAWDYTGTFLSINGRTNGMFMAMWGMLGVMWIKILLPWVLRVVNLIPWKLRYTLTTICAALMLTNAVMTLQALDCWYERLSGRDATTPVEQFYANYFDDAYMTERFQSMTINPDDAARVPQEVAA